MPTSNLSTIGSFGTRTRGVRGFRRDQCCDPVGARLLRLDWFTPDGLPTWGDGRLFLSSAPKGRWSCARTSTSRGDAGTDHMFVANRTTTRYMDCSTLPVTYLPRYSCDIAERYRDGVAAGAGFHCVPAWRCGRRPRRSALWRLSGRDWGLRYRSRERSASRTRSFVDLADRVRVVHGRRLRAKRGAGRAERYGFPTTTDIARAIADPAVDAVMVLTPTNAHLEIAEAAFAAGKHVFCEKPLEATLERGERLIAAGRRANRRLGYVCSCAFGRAASG